MMLRAPTCTFNLPTETIIVIVHPKIRNRSSQQEPKINMILAVTGRHTLRLGNFGPSPVGSQHTLVMVTLNVPRVLYP